MVATSYNFAALGFVSAVFAVPITPVPAVPRSLSLVGGRDYGLPSDLGNFDDFYGSSNFHGRPRNKVIVKQEERLVCRRVKVEIVQQQLTVLRELMKRIVTRQVCEVELQTILIEQFRGGVGSFSDDIRRNGKSRDSISYDEEIANHISRIIREDGDLSEEDLGFKGSDVGKKSRRVTGDNWNDKTSPSKIGKIYKETHDLSLKDD
jgi:hypothetical protein